jgi:hypothetical protein
MILSSIRQANHHHVNLAGESAGQPLKRVFERYTHGKAAAEVRARRGHRGWLTERG